MEKTEQYKRYLDEYNAIEEAIASKEQECIKSGMPWDKFVEETRGLKLRQFELDKEMRLIQHAGMEGEKKWKGTVMTLNEFKERSLSGEYDDLSGRFYYSIGKNKSDVIVLPSDAEFEKLREDFPNVIKMNDDTL